MLSKSIDISYIDGFENFGSQKDNDQHSKSFSIFAHH